MIDFFLLLATLSLASSIPALLFLAVHPLIRGRCTKTLQYYLLLFVLLRFLVPISFPFSSGMQALFPTGVGAVASAASVSTTQQEPAAQATEKPTQQAAAEIPSNVTVPAKQPQADGSPQFLQSIGWLVLLFGVWLMGVLVSLFVPWAGYIRLRRALRKTARPASETLHALLAKTTGHTLPVYLSLHAQSPMLLGLIRPYMVLPDANFSVQQYADIFRHEMAHCRRGDIACKWAVAAICAVHWFNPVVHWVRREMDRACELSCDEIVTRSMDTEARRAYGETLLAVAAQTRTIPGALYSTMSEDMRAMKERLVSILQKKRPELVSLASIALVALLAASAFASCAVVRSPFQGGGTAQSQSSAQALSGAPITFTSLIFTVPPSDHEYKTTDVALMNQIWNTMQTGRWVRTDSYPASKALEVDVRLKFKGAYAGEYYISGGAGYYSPHEPDENEITVSAAMSTGPLGIIGRDDQSYRVPPEIFAALESLLTQYEKDHPTTLDLPVLLDEIFRASDTTLSVSGYPKLVYPSKLDQDTFAVSMTNAFGDTNQWQETGRDPAIVDGKTEKYAAFTHQYLLGQVSVYVSYTRNRVDISYPGLQDYHYLISSETTDRIKNVVEQYLPKS